MQLKLSITVRLDDRLASEAPQYSHWFADILAYMPPSGRHPRLSNCAGTK